MRRFLLRFLRVLCLLTLVGSVVLWVDSYWHFRSFTLRWGRVKDARLVQRTWEVNSGPHWLSICFTRLECDWVFANALFSPKPGTPVVESQCRAARNVDYPFLYYHLSSSWTAWRGVRWGVAEVFRRYQRGPSNNETDYGMSLPYWLIALLSATPTASFLLRRWRRRRGDRGFAVQFHNSPPPAPAGSAEVL